MPDCRRSENDGFVPDETGHSGRLHHHGEEPVQVELDVLNRGVAGLFCHAQRQAHALVQG